MSAVSSPVVLQRSAREMRDAMAASVLLIENKSITTRRTIHLRFR